MDGKTISRESRTIRLTSVGFGQLSLGLGNITTQGVRTRIQGKKKKEVFAPNVSVFIAFILHIFFSKKYVNDIDHHLCTTQKYI